MLVPFVFTAECVMVTAFRSSQVLKKMKMRLAEGLLETSVFVWEIYVNYTKPDELMLAVSDFLLQCLYNTFRKVLKYQTSDILIPCQYKKYTSDNISPQLLLERSWFIPVLHFQPFCTRKIKLVNTCMCLQKIPCLLEMIFSATEIPTGSQKI